MNTTHFLICLLYIYIWKISRSLKVHCKHKSEMGKRSGICGFHVSAMGKSKKISELRGLCKGRQLITAHNAMDVRAL